MTNVLEVIIPFAFALFMFGFMMAVLYQKRKLRKYKLLNEFINMFDEDIGKINDIDKLTTYCRNKLDILRKIKELESDKEIVGAIEKVECIISNTLKELYDPKKSLKYINSTNKEA